MRVLISELGVPRQGIDSIFREIVPIRKVIA